MSKLSFRARALDASKPMPIYLAEELPDLPDYSAINRAVPQMPSGMEKEEESEHHLQRAISGTGLIIPTPEVCQVSDLEFYERCYPPDYKMPKQHIHMQPLWEEQEAPEYDMDSEDERWLKQQRHPELTELKFEQMMDKLEKSSGQTVVTLHEAKLLLERQDDLVIAVFDYWLNKRLTTQHPLILSVKTENRPGQSTNNPYLAFRRRTEKMQTRKNRKNDESSYEKMLKLRRDLAHALKLLELVAQRERAKRELVKLTALLSERRYVAGDFANQLLPDPPPRPQYTVPLSSSNFRRETFTNVIPHYPPRPPPTPVDQPRQREKRTYKRRKHRHAAVGATGLRDSGVYTSSEEESPRVEPPSPPDDGPFAFRRKPGCYYEMPTSTLYGDPVDPDSPSKDGLYQHEIDPRHRYNLTSLRHPYPTCIGFARRRVGRGGRLILDRVSTPLDDLWHHLPFDPSGDKRRAEEELELETKRYRTPKEITRDYHTSGKYPWRHAFRRHLSRNPDLWTEEAPPPKLEPDEVKQEDLKPQVKVEPSDLPDVIQDSVKHDSVIKDSMKQDSVIQDSVKPDSVLQDSVKSDISVRTTESVSGKRKRSWSDCSDSSYDSDESLQPVEKEFEKFIDEVNKKWLHFRPKTPPPSPPLLEPSEDQFPVSLDTPISVELRGRSAPSEVVDTFMTSQFTLGGLYPDLADVDNSGASLDISGDDLLPEHFTGLTEDQVESILSETDLKTLAEVDEKKMVMADDLLDHLVSHTDKDPFLLPGQSAGRDDSGPRTKKTEPFGSSVVSVRSDASEPLYCAPPKPATPPPPPPPKEKTPPLNVVPPRGPPPRPAPPPPAPPAPPAQTTVEEVQVAPGVQIKTVQTSSSPLKKHIITSGARYVRAEPAQPQLVTVAVSDTLKVRLQNHLLSTQSGVLVQNGPFPPVVVPVQQQRDTGVTSVSNLTNVSVAGTSSRRVSAPLVHLAPTALSSRQFIHPQHPSPPVVVAQSHTIHHVAPNKLKVLHAHPLTPSQRTQLLAQNRNVSQLPTVVSLATLGEAKTSNALLKAASGSVAQLFEIKSGQLGKGPHLVNVVRQPQPGKATTVTRLDLNDKKRQVVFDGTLKGNIATATRPNRVSVSLDGRQIVRTGVIPAVRTPVRTQIQLKNRTLQVAPQIARSATEPSTSITIAAPPTKTTSIPSSVVSNLLHKNIQLPKGGQKIAISGPGGQALSANVQAIAISAAHVKARQARLIAQPRPAPVNEIVEASTAPVPTTSQQETPIDGEETETNGTVRRRTADSLPMEVT